MTEQPRLACISRLNWMEMVVDGQIGRGRNGVLASLRDRWTALPQARTASRAQQILQLVFAS